MNLILQKRLSA